MPTTEQLKLRRERILEHVELIRTGGLDVSKIPYNLRIAVLGHALDVGCITAADVPPKLANDVALDLLKEAAPRQRDMAADRGTEVHALAEAITNGEKVEIPSELRGHIYAWQRWRDDWQMEFEETEFTVFSAAHYYAGTGDFLGRSGLHPELDLICGDYKTSESGIWPDIALQLSGIWKADFIGRADGTEDRGVLSNIKSFVGVQITGDGYKVVPVKVSEGTFRVFLAASTVARWKRDFEQFALDQTAQFITTKEIASV